MALTIGAGVANQEPQMSGDQLFFCLVFGLHCPKE